MNRKHWIAAIALLALAAGPAAAGEYRCTASAQDCLNHMALKLKTSGFVGVELDKNDTTGVLTVTKIIPDSPAQAAGIQPGDVLYALNGIEIAKASEEDLAKARKEWKPGQSVTYTIKRNGADRQVSLTLAPMPADIMARWIGMHMLEHASVAVAEK